MIYLTGDIHGHHSINKLANSRWPEGKKLTKDDYLIVLGDFGLIWKDEPDNNEKYWLKWLDERPWTTLFIDGNHENHTRLYNLPTKPMFGNTVGICSESVFHLKRGEVYNIAGKTFFTMGGAFSIDRSDRVLNKSWWEAEVPTVAEFEHGLRSLLAVGNKVDYILGHTTSTKAINRMLTPHWLLNDPTATYFDRIEEYVSFRRFYFGHWHKDFDDNTHRAVYHNIVLLGE